MIWRGPVFDPSGYGEASRSYVVAMHGDGLDVSVWPVQFYPRHIPPVQAWDVLAPLCGRETHGRRTVFIQHMPPPNWRFNMGKGNLANVGVTTFETDSVPREWMERIASMDEIWVPSWFNKRTFEDAGVRRDVKVIPHGVDTQRFHPDAVPMEVPGADLDFLFGSVFDMIPRKDPTTLLTAFMTAFHAREGVGLVLKVFSQFGDEDVVARAHALIRSIRHSVRASDPPPVFVLDQSIVPDRLMPGFYTAMDGYVSASRGEGWGLTISEAMASGLPVIASAWGGQADYMDHENSVPLNDYRVCPVQNHEASAQPQYAGHQWAVLDVDALAAAMRRVVAMSGEERSTMSMHARRSMKEWTWNHAAKAIKARVAHFGR